MVRDPEEEKLNRLLGLFEVANRDTISPDDIAEVIEVILTALIKVRDDANNALEAANQETAGQTKKISDTVASKIGEVSTAVGNHRKLIDKLLAWKDQQGQLTLQEDIQTAIDIGRDNEEDIVRIRTIVEGVKKEKGERGARGRMPRHKWVGTTLYFEDPDGNWDDGTDLQGEPGEVMHHGGDQPFGSIGQDLRPGSPNVRINNGRIYVDNTGGSTMSLLAPDEAPDDSRVVFTFAVKPFEIVINGSSYRESHGWSWDAGASQATIFAPVGTPAGPYGDIYARIQI